VEKAEKQRRREKKVEARAAREATAAAKREQKNAAKELALTKARNREASPSLETQLQGEIAANWETIAEQSLPLRSQ
jgi:hypothetical protein